MENLSLYDQVVLFTTLISLIIVIQFLLNMMGFSDIDVDLDSGMDLSDIISFKGCTHFLLGSSWYLFLVSRSEGSMYQYSILDLILSIVSGVLFTIILFKCYQWVMKLRCEHVSEPKSNLIGRLGEILYILSDSKYIILIKYNSSLIEMECKSRGCKNYLVGDNVEILSASDDIVYIK